MIEPDTKNWTWVLERRCPECGFDVSAVARSDLADLVRANAAAWQAFGADGGVVPGPSDRQVWSSLEYAAHVRDVYRTFSGRLALMLTQDDPLFENWDQDETAIADRYDEQPPEVVVTDLVAAATSLALSIDEVGESQWHRGGQRSDGSQFTVESLLRYLIHDPVHHLWDVSGSDPAR
jgi:hypothetical protein